MVPEPRYAVVIDEWMSDIAAVMSAVGSEKATIVGFGAGGPLSILFAATHPEVVTALVLIRRQHSMAAVHR